MSKVKLPREMKRLSLERDRRNIYGESPSSSRKNIARGKQRSHMEQRRAAAETLRQLQGKSEHLNTDETESQLRTRLIDLQRHAFRKVADAPLSAVIQRKLASRKTKLQKANKARVPR